MQFNTKEIVVDKTCTEFTINLQHTGKLPKAAMGHNVVVTKEADKQGAATDGMAAGLDNDYVKPDDARVIAHTPVIGGGESTSVKFDVSKLAAGENRSEEHTSELQSLMRISYAVFCLKQKKKKQNQQRMTINKKKKTH